MSKPQVRTLYSDTDGWPGVDCSNLPSMTDQSQARDCDINEIMRRYEKTGALPQMIAKDPQWGDFSAAPDFQQACEIVLKAEEQFAALDAHVRKRFSNDPAEFLEFVNDPANGEEMVRLGLRAKKEEAPNGLAGNSEGSSGGSAVGAGGSQGGTPPAEGSK